MTTIWMYWESPAGTTKPEYLDLCLQTIEMHKGILDLVVLDEASVRNYIPDLRADIDRLSLVHRSDYYRSRLIYRHGGVWLDADVIAMRPLQELIEYLGTEEVAFYGRGDSNLSINCFVGRRGAACLEDWMLRQDQLLHQGREIPWNGLGKDSLVEASRHHSYASMPFGRISPIPWQKWKWVVSRRRSPKPFLVEDPIVFMLYNKFLVDELAGFSKEELLRSNMLVSKLFRLALGTDS